LTHKRRVMIVDRSAETRGILRTLLEREGSETVEVADPRLATELTECSHPDLIVFDLDSDRSSGRTIVEQLGTAASRKRIPIVVLGTVGRDLTPLPTGHLVAKPYHYGPLLRRIDAILGHRS